MLMMATEPRSDGVIPRSKIPHGTAPCSNRELVTSGHQHVIAPEVVKQLAKILYEIEQESDHRRTNEADTRLHPPNA